MNQEFVKTLVLYIPANHILIRLALTSLCSTSDIGAGVILCIEKALAHSGVSREDVNYINAHATSTPGGDLKEYHALMHCFGQNSVVNFLPFIIILFFRTILKVILLV